jgi:methylmalonyl-CoA mutase N-terminal domain/subunit
MRTQQILAYETGVASVSDPLGGSYYIEELTDRMEEEILKVMDEVDSQGGMYKAISSKWLDRQFEEAAVAEQNRIEKGEHRVVGVNVMRGERDTETPGGVQEIDSEIEGRIIGDLKRFKEERSKEALQKSIDHLRREAEKGEKQNLVPAVIDCVKANATLSEIMGIIREAYGYPYDEFGVVSCPF